VPDACPDDMEIKLSNDTIANPLKRG